MQLQTTTKTITEHTFTLSAEDLARYMEDPWQFREDVLSLGKSIAQHKNGGGTDVSNGSKPAKRTVRHAQDITVGRVKMARKPKANGAAPKHRGATGRIFPKVECPKCGQMIAKPQLGRHESKCVGGAADAASDSN